MGQIYEVIVFVCILILAGYDIRYQRVSDRALAFFLPVVMSAPFIRSLEGGTWSAVIGSAVESGLGAVTAFGILLAAAFFSYDASRGAGIGGGDIKLALLMGFIYGLARIIFLLLTAVLAAAIVTVIIRLSVKKGKGKLSLPFVPFLACGSLAVTVIQIFN